MTSLYMQYVLTLLKSPATSGSHNASRFAFSSFMKGEQDASPAASPEAVLIYRWGIDRPFAFLPPAAFLRRVVEGKWTGPHQTPGGMS